MGERLLLGARFRVELRGALCLRRLGDVAMRVDEVEELRAEAVARYLESRRRARCAGSPLAAARRAISLAVYHRCCRDWRRHRAGRVVPMGPWSAWLRVPESAGGGERSEPAAVDGLVECDRPAVAPERHGVGRVFVGLADGVLAGRGGCGRAKESRGLAKPPDAEGRWLRACDGDASSASAAVDLVASMAVDRTTPPREVVSALHDAARWPLGTTTALARLARATITEPAAPATPATGFTQPEARRSPRSRPELPARGDRERE